MKILLGERDAGHRSKTPSWLRSDAYNTRCQLEPRRVGGFRKLYLSVHEKKSLQGSSALMLSICLWRTMSVPYRNMLNRSS